MSLDYVHTPLPVVWPGKATADWERRRPLFKAGWLDTIQLLDREIGQLEGTNTEIAVDVDVSGIRRDGKLNEARALVRGAAVVVSFDTPERGRLQFPADTFTDWRANVRAVALALEALRAVDRYGVQAGRQYTGFKALPSTTSASLSVIDAVRILVTESGADPIRETNGLLHDRFMAQDLVRRARSKAHPDSGGTADRFARVQSAAAVLEAQLGGRL